MLAMIITLFQVQQLIKAVKAVSKFLRRIVLQKRQTEKGRLFIDPVKKVLTDFLISYYQALSGSYLDWCQPT